MINNKIDPRKQAISGMAKGNQKISTSTRIQIEGTMNIKLLPEDYTIE